MSIRKIVERTRGRRNGRERMLSLKRSRAGQLGYLNRLYKDAEILMQNADICHEACKKKKADKAYDEYYQFANEPEVNFNACPSTMTEKKGIRRTL